MPTAVATDYLSNRAATEFPEVKNICCIGAGYVGGPTCALLAWKCPDITVNICDVSQDRIDAWNSEDLPIFEPGLDEVVKQARGRNLFFTTEVDAAIRVADLIFVSVNTPTKTQGIGAGCAADLCYVEAATRRIASVVERSVIIVEKSTVPCRTAESMRTILGATSPRLGVHFEILSNPEFLAEGTAIDDLLDPARILIGAEPTELGQLAQRRLVEVYSRWVAPKRIITTNLWSSELSKLAANALLAQRVSSINALAAICESTGASVFEVSRACGMDPRIGSKFLQAGLGFGGSCFQKDIFNLIYLSRTLGLEEVATYWNQVLAMNEWTKKRFSRHIVKTMFSTITRKYIAVLGYAFKKDTGDIREAPAINVARDLLEDGAQLKIYDPKVPATAIHASLHPHTSSNFSVKSSLLQACHGAAAIVIITDWDEFKAEEVDWQAIYDNMSRPAFVFDGRRVVDVKKLTSIGFKVHQTGTGAALM